MIRLWRSVPRDGCPTGPAGRPYSGRLLVLSLALVALFGCRLEDREPEPDEPPPREIVREEALEGDEVEVEEAPSEDEPAEPPVLEVDEAFWVEDAPAGVELVGRFISPEALEATLERDQPVGRFEGREWTLGDILVQVDYRGGPDMATWRVAGPEPLIREYVTLLQEQAGDRSPLRELGILPLHVRFCCPPQGREAVPPDQS